MPIPREFDFANYDVEVAKLVHGENKYPAWTIIVSFYASLHLVRGKLFPLKDVQGSASILVASFDHYCNLHQADSKSKHQKLIMLVAIHLPNISSKYKWLFDNSVTARYNNYNFDPSYGDTAYKYMEAIRTECNPVIGSPAPVATPSISTA